MTARFLPAEENKISVRQICFILFCYNAAVKLVVYPALTAVSVMQDIIFPALLNFVAHGIVVWATAYLSSRTDKTFFALLKGSFGRVAARVIYVLFALYFLFSAVVPINEQQLLVHAAFYDTVPALYIFLPFFVFSVYVGAKNFTNAGRCADLCFPVFIICTVALLVMSAGEGDYSELLPVLKTPAKTLGGYSVSSLFRFDEAAFILMFMGHYKYRRGDAAKITASYAAGGAVVIIFLAVFYAVYGVMTPTRPFLLAEISVFFPAISYVGRVDLALLFAFDIVILFAVVIRVQMCVQCLGSAICGGLRPIFSLAANAALIAVTFILNGKATLLQSVAGSWFFIPAIVFAYVIPLAAWCLRRKKH